MSCNSRLVGFLWISVLFLVGTAQANNRQADKEQPAEETDILFLQFSDSTFDLTQSDVVEDEDQTPQGKQRLREIEGIAAAKQDEYHRLRDAVAPDYAKLVTQKQLLLKHQALVVQANNSIAHQSRLIAKLQQGLKMLPPNLQGDLRNKIQKCRTAINAANNVIAAQQQPIDVLRPKILGLHAIVDPILMEMQQVWNELEDCRAQWCTIRQPALKYARGDYVLLRKVLDDWLVIDGLWPSAYVWAALCANSSGDSEAGFGYIDKAEKLRQLVRYPFAWPAVAACHAIVLRDFGGTEGRNHSKFLSIAVERMKRLEKSRINHEWDTYFILGIYYSESEQHHFRAKACFERALKHNPKDICAQVGLARLQIYSKNEKIRDYEAGLDTLQKLWNKSGTKTWRLAGDLARAFDANGESEKAKEMWEFVKQNATKTESDQLLAKLRDARIGSGQIAGLRSK